MKLFVFISLCFSFNLFASFSKIYIISSEQTNKTSNIIKNIFTKQDPKYIPLQKNDKLDSKECSYCSSHKAAWKDIVKNGYKKAIIFEDHVIFHKNFNQNFKQIIKNIPKDFDIFFLDIGLDKPAVEKTYFVEPEFWLSNFSNTESIYYAKIKKSKKLWGLHAYCISSLSAKKLLQITETLSRSLDTAVIDKSNELNLYVSKIKLVSGNYDILTRVHTHTES